jgi:drug/metabolite transporter (DMT)-like permease
MIATNVGDPYIAGVSGKLPWNSPAAFLPLIGLALAGIGRRKGKGKNRRRSWLLLGVLFVFCGVGFYGCTGTKSNFQNLGTTPGVYTITVTGVSWAVQHSTTITLTVNP